MIMRKGKCSWCSDRPINELPEDPDPDTLCIWHLAELEGLSVDEMERRDREQAAEFYDSIGTMRI